MNFELFSYAVLALMVIVVIIFLYASYKSFKAKNNPSGLLNLALAIVFGVAVYAIYGELIIELIN